MTSLTIGKLAEVASTKVQTIRYYETIGLLRPFARSAGGHRIYGPEDARRLRFIRHARELGFGIDEIRELLRLSAHPDLSCAEVDTIGRTHLDQVESRISQLQSLRRELKQMITACSQGRVGQCRIMGTLNNT
jgi:DNA-binding transcriptional MerR regulator